MIYERNIIVTEKNDNRINDSNIIFRFTDIKNGKPDWIEMDIFNALKDMEKAKIITLRKIFNMFKAEFGLDIGDIIYYKK